MKRARQAIRWLMLVAGLLTCTMFQAAIAPEAALQASFGATIQGPIAEIVVRNWGALIGLVGLLLIYGAWRESARVMALCMAVASKLVFITLVLTLGQEFLQFQVGLAVWVDGVIVALFVAYLVADRLSGRATAGAA